MRKNLLLSIDTIKNIEIKHFIRMMRLSVLFILLSVFSAHATVSKSQNIRITLTEKALSLNELFNEIEKQTDYLFIYDKNEIDLQQKVKVEARNQEVSEVLDNTLKDTGITYEFSKNYISLRKAKLGKTGLVQSQQEKKISGIVTDVNGEPVIGANVMEKGTSNGTITDIDGKFFLNIGSEDATLVVSYIGYISSEIRMKGKTFFSISLKEDTKTLDEVVVVGYTSMKRELLTGSVASMKMTDELKNTPSISPADVLAGKLAGVNVSSADGLPGNQSSLSIRAKSSWNAQDVLYVIDGMISNADDFNSLSANEIENVTVLKDAASTAIYGSRAAGGVVVVTTRAGSYGEKLRLEYSFNTGVDKRGKELELTDGVKTAELYMRINPTSDPAGWAWSKEEIEQMKTINNGWGYDILDAVWQDPKVTTHNIGISGGSEKVKFYAGGSITKQDGFMENLTYKKKNLRLNISAKLSKDLEAYCSLSYKANEKQHMTGGSRIGNIYSLYKWLLAWQPDYPIYTDGGSPIDIGWWGSIPAQIRGDGGYLRSWGVNPTLNMSLNYKLPFLEGLSVKASYSKSYLHNRTKNYQKRYKMVRTKKSGKHFWLTSDDNIVETVMSSQVPKEFLEESSSWTDNEQYNMQLSYDHVFNNLHNVKASVVFEKYESSNGGMLAGVENFPVYNTDQWWATGADRADSYVSRDAKYSDQSLGRQSWIGQLYYDYSGKYLLGFNYRYDGSMNFSPDQRWGFFPSGSVGWIISKEPFFNTKVVNFLKLRASVGLTGNDAIGGWQWQQSYISANSGYYGTKNGISNGITYGVLPNEKLTWEKSMTYNIGVDLDFLEHFDLSAEYYFTRTYDILGTRSLDVPPTFSLKLPAENYGEVHANGAEMKLGYSNTFNDFNVFGSLILSYANATYKKYDDDKVTYDFQKRVGRSLTAVYGYKADRIIRSQEELDKFNAEHPDFNFNGIKPDLGQLIYKDLSGPDGAPDGVVNNYDRVMLKKSNNPFVLGLSLGAEWKGIAVNTVFSGNIGQERFIDDIFHTFEWNRMWVKTYTDCWTPENPNAPMPKRLGWGSGDKTYNQPTDFWLRDASFVRLKNLTVSYTLPQKLTKSFGLNKLQFYFVGTNVFTMGSFNKNYYDAEMSNGFSFPIMKSYNFGVSVAI